MRFPTPLLPGRLLRRYKRFLADIELVSGEIVTAHCANPGAMLGLTEPGAEVWLSRSSNPARRLAYTWELVRTDGGFAGINTNHPNRLVAEALAERRIAGLDCYDTIRQEVAYGRNSRVDFLLERSGAACYVEVKNVHLCRDGETAEFPDCVTARGRKHLGELSRMVAAGHRAVMLYLVQRSDCVHFRIASDLDPAYAAAFRAAQAAGVEVLCYACRVDPREITLDRSLSACPDETVSLRQEQP